MDADESAAAGPAMHEVSLGGGGPEGAPGQHAATLAPARTKSTVWRDRMAVVLSGLGLMTDVYDLQVINLARPLIAIQHEMSASDEAMITSAAIVGATVGMLLFGALADRLGRRTMFLLTALLTSLGAIASACALGRGAGIYTELAAWRFVMGVGIGGEYPLSAANSAEHGASRGGRQIALTYSMMGWGGLLAPCVFLLLQLLQLPPAFVWRFGFAFGGFMSVTGTVLRLLFLEDSLKFAQARDEGLRQSKGHGGYLWHTAAVIRAYWRPLLGTASCWFLFDIYEYGLNLYTSDILLAAGVARASSPLDATMGVLVLRLCTIPGYLGSILLIAAIGRRQTLDFGFASIGLAFSALGLFWAQAVAHPALFFALFGAAQVLDNAGCNAATYVIPAELFPSQIRATCHGLSAAAGKVGAAVGSAAFPLVAHAVGLRGVFLACATICAVGLCASAMLLPTYDDETVAGIDEAHQRGNYLTHLYSDMNLKRGEGGQGGCCEAGRGSRGGGVRLADDGAEMGSLGPPGGAAKRSATRGDGGSGDGNANAQSGGTDAEEAGEELISAPSSPLSERNGSMPGAGVMSSGRPR